MTGRPSTVSALAERLSTATADAPLLLGWDVTPIDAQPVHIRLYRHQCRYYVTRQPLGGNEPPPGDHLSVNAARHLFGGLRMKMLAESVAFPRVLRRDRVNGGG